MCKYLAIVNILLYIRMHAYGSVVTHLDLKLMVAGSIPFTEIDFKQKSHVEMTIVDEWA